MGAKRTLVCFLLLVGAALAVYLRRADRMPVAKSNFAAPETCYECHEVEQAEWRDSHHDLAMQEATEATVLGDFDDASFDHFGLVSRFFRRDGRFFVNTEGPDGKLRDYEVKYTFGVAPLQQYLVELDGGRLQALQVSWDTAKRRWFHIQDERIRPGDPLHWTGPQFNWNYMCAECHSTDVKKNYDPETNSYASTWFEIDVGCQGCHGPGAEHVLWARATEEPEEGYDPDDPKGFAVLFADARGEVEACARCHSRRVIVSGDYEYGRPYLDHHAPVLYREGLYHADGQILDEVFVYGSFLRSKMYRNGVRCTDCHDPHTARLKLPGNATCVRCHQTNPPTQFETIEPKEYDTPEHHFHQAGKPGTQCVECHMPARNYMVVDPRHDHGFTIPRPDLTATLDVPNACNSCHDDQSAEWAAEAIEKWYFGGRAPHYAPAFAAARAGHAEAAPALAAIVQDEEQAGIVRATALELLARFPVAGALAAATGALDDEDALVRGTAVRALEQLPAPRKARLLAPRLKDPVRWVRTEAARLVTAEDARPEGFEEALEEFYARQEAVADRPEAHLNLGVVHANLGKLAEAERAYRRALELDDGFLPARFNLANLYNRMQRQADAERELRAILARAPRDGEAHYSLGLLLAEMKRLPEAAEHLGRAAALLPGRPRVAYNFGLALQHLGRRAEAEDALLQALAAAPRDPAILNAVVILYVQDRRWREALPHARMLAEVAPEAQGMVERIRAELAR